MTFDQLKDILAEQGWKMYKDTLNADYRYGEYATRRPKYSNHDCTCNEKPPLFWVRFSNMHLIFPQAVVAIHCEVEIGGQIVGDLWPLVKIGISPEQLTDTSEFDRIERMLCAAWNNMNESYHVPI